MASNDEDDVDMNLVEFTLEDTYDHLKDLKHEREQKIKKMIDIIKNNEVRKLEPTTPAEEIRLKRFQFVQSMRKFVALEQPQNLPVPNTPDFYTDALKELEDEVYAMEELDKITDEEIADLETDIAYMEKKKSAFEQIKEASLNAADSETTNYETEMVVTKRLFQEVKKDLATVVEALFPGNVGFQELLCVLTRALSKGGDDLYIDVTPNVLDFVNFLHEAAIIQFHPNDGTKIKLINL
ncbi:hypothetical protein TSAR_012031 [Trichomalopsis sarcophagae]|uniref:Uncharacterized protein n=1 Tax=Trichomalopsis sarcophagae TaxID=543379 RepID=A0A232F816_9HYME|nr:hypothetical protein TSAR_012031 [Trichomalopsis sarcophagae]